MSNKITGKEYPLAKIFSSDFEYHIPGYQRPYAWTEVETGVLFEDLYDFFQTEQVDNYFLGSIVLIKKDDNKPFVEVIDGQQRLITLTILFAAMADASEKEKYKQDCKKYLIEEGNELEGIQSQPRIFIKERERDFFSAYIQNGDLDGLEQATLDTEAKQHIKRNCGVLRERLKDTFKNDEELFKFSQFLLTRCFLVSVSTSNQESAFRIFSVMNSRGLNLLPTDIIKSKTIGKLEPAEQLVYTNKWEDLENTVGREGFNEVFTHTRTIFVKERPKRNLLEEFEKYVMRMTSPKDLIDKYLVPYTAAYDQLKNSTFSATEKTDEINDLLYWLNKINNYDWMPPAIKFLSEHPNDSAYVLWFIRKLERLASYLLITAQDVNRRTDRYKWILAEMDRRTNHSLEKPLINIELTNWEKKRFKEALDGEIYTMTAQRRNYILQRLDSFVSDGAASYDTNKFSIEHVLPRNPAADSEWMKLWPDIEQQKYWINRIANLVPLTRKHNSAALNRDFNTKKEKYFRSKNGTSSYALTTQVLGIDEWTPGIVEKRQEELGEIFLNRWELGEKPFSTDDHPVFNLVGRGADAKGYPEYDNRFVVLKGSKISYDMTNGIPSSMKLKRQDLIDAGIVINQVFEQDYEFTSPSTAASVILGRSSNGHKEWTKIDGQTLAQSGY